MEKQEDRRVRKTKKLIEDALFKLICEKPLKNITVREIAEEADINRGTFYLHYKDVYDMVDKLQNDFFEKLYIILDSFKADRENENIFPILKHIFMLLAEKGNVTKYLMGKNGDPFFIDKLKELLMEKCFKNIKKALNIKEDINFEYFFNYVVLGCIGVIDIWLTNGMKESPEEMAEITEKLILGDFL